MPIIKSAKKASRQAEKRHVRNRETISKMRSYIRQTLELVKKGDKQTETEKMIGMTYSMIDKAMKKHLIHRNNAARKKSRLARSFAKAFSLSQKSTS